MERAARWIAQRCEHQLMRMPPSTWVMVLAGPGNNGMDALLAGDLLEKRGFLVVGASLVPGSDRELLDFADASERIKKSSHPCLVIDGLLGLGARPERPLSDAMQQVIQTANRHAAFRVAVDGPTGVNMQSGAVANTAYQADLTLSLLARKTGFATGQALSACGQIECNDLGVNAAEYLDDPAPMAWQAQVWSWPQRDPMAHKGTQGCLHIIGAGRGMSGALGLAAAGAQALGVGKIVGVSQTPMVTGAQLPVDCITALWSDPITTLPSANSRVTGCGMGTDAEALAMLKPLIQRPEPLVLDADALNLVALNGDLLEGLQRRSVAGQVTVLTPHPLEAARLLGPSHGVASMEQDRWASLQALVESTGSIVVLKGPGTLIGAPGVTPIAISGPHPLLATAGTGDVLAGMIGALLAHREHGQDPIAAVVAAACWHAQGAQLAQEQGVQSLRAGELPDWVRRALAQVTMTQSARPSGATDDRSGPPALHHESPG
jgi:ADP-dependent NAD(P)H-hydrate dehydratase / NAD(P)H-hydrate epimerase